MLSQNDIKDLFYYQDGELYWKEKRGTNSVQVPAGALTGTYKYRTIGFEGKRYYAHRLIYMLHHGYLPKIVDHINRDRLDNRIENLRSVTPSESSRNCKRAKPPKSGYKGVTQSANGRKFHTKIALQRKNIFVGAFDTAEQAAKEYDKAARELHGEFAVLNFPEEVGTP